MKTCSEVVSLVEKSQNNTKIGNLHFREVMLDGEHRLSFVFLQMEFHKTQIDNLVAEMNGFAHQVQHEAAEINSMASVGGDHCCC